MGVTKEQEQFYSVLETLTVMEVYSNGVQQIDGFGLKNEAGITVLDTGCVKTVAGKVWLDSFINTLRTKTKNMISVLGIIF